MMLGMIEQDLLGRLLRSVRMSALALLKMAMHARSGGALEVRCQLTLGFWVFIREMKVGEGCDAPTTHVAHPWQPDEPLTGLTA